MAFLAKNLFSSYHFDPPASSGSQDRSQTPETDLAVPPFSISLPSLLETLQIFGVGEAAKPNPWRREPYGGSDAFSAQVLGISGICRLAYAAPGSPLVVVLEETGITTTCELVTYEPSFTADIPFARDELSLKVIMGASYLSDAISELSTANPENLTIGATAKSFTLSSSGALGAAVVQFHRDAQSSKGGDVTSPVPEKGVLETFLVPNGAFNQSYRFAHIAAARKAMDSAVKVSVRGDEQGVLSLQLMIENVEGQGVSFVDFRFVPTIDDGDEQVEANQDSD
jgi:cell cycle checkpoint protein